MKIVNIEDGIKKIYVQRKDIKKLLDYERTIPVTIFDKYFSDIFSFGLKKKDDEFEVFSDQFEVNFLESLDWIVDYREFKHLRDEEILEKESFLISEQKNIAQQYNETSIHDDKKRKNLLLKYNSYYYRFVALKEIIQLKQGKLTIPFPEIPDCKGFVIDNDEKFIARQGLSPLQFFIYKKDGSTMIQENIEKDFFLAALGESVKYNLDNNEHFDHFVIEKNLSKDLKCFSTTFKIIPKKVEQDGTLGKNNSDSLIKRINERFFRSVK